MNQKIVYQKVKTYYLLAIMPIIMLLFNAGIAQIYLDSTATVEARVADLLGRMTLDEKIGQMVQVEYPVLSAAGDIQSYGLGSLLLHQSW
jgi:hypothetical protein